MSKLKEIIRNADTIMVAGHVRPDGDCVGACVAMYHYILHNFPDKTIVVYLETLPERFAFLDADKKIFSGQIPAESFDLFIVLDSSSSDRLGDAEVAFMKAKQTLCIDHHVSNANYADINIVRPEACASCEVLFGLMGEDALITEIATALYVGIICDSGVFRYSSASAGTMEIAGKLMQTGIPFPQLIDRCISMRTFTQTRLLGEALLSSTLLLDDKCIVAVVTKAVMEKYGALTEDIEGIVEQLRVVQGVEAAVLLHEMDEGVYKVSLRTNDMIDASRIAVYFDGGGHKNAAGFTLSGTKQDVIQMVTGQILAQLHGDKAWTE